MDRTRNLHGEDMLSSALREHYHVRASHSGTAMNAREVLASVTGFCDACGAGPGVVCDPFCVGVAAAHDALPYCPCCEGTGEVPSPSGLTDTACLCSGLSGNDRVILHGRADTLTAWAGRQPEECAKLLSTMIHLVAGCSGRCRGNAGADRCFL